MPAEPPATRVVLVGFMGAGKTVVGSLVAAALGWPHLDLDRWVEARAGCSVAELFATEGEAAFRAGETDATRAAALRHRVVISTGGGWVLNPAHRQMLAEGTVVVWLRVKLETALARAADEAGSRPLMATPERARELLTAREPLYRLAHHTVDTDEMLPAQVAEEILQRVQPRILPA